MVMRLSIWAVALLSGAQLPAPNRIPSRPEPGPSTREFAPGVRIDWIRRLVEVDATVVLREGALELVACSPKTREHESIVAVRARPMHIFQAMGLVGLKPGSPVRYDEKQNRRLPPTGHALSLQVRYHDQGTERLVPVEHWLLNVQQRRPPEKLHWVLAGSRTFENGRFGADVEGTVVCVVDFDTALITVDTLHSADNELLWLRANPKTIPPVGTACTLLISSAVGRIVEFELTGDGRLHRDGALISAKEVARVCEPLNARGLTVTVVLRASADASDKVIHTAVNALVDAGLDRSSIDVREAGLKGKTVKPSEPVR